MSRVTGIALLTAWLVAALSSVPAMADVPHKVNYQVMLTDEGNEPLPGSHEFIFRIFSAEGLSTVFLYIVILFSR